MRVAKARIRNATASFLQQPPDSETRRLRVVFRGANVRPGRLARFRLGEARLPSTGVHARVSVGLACNKLHPTGRWGSLVATL